MMTPPTTPPVTGPSRGCFSELVAIAVEYTGPAEDAGTVRNVDGVKYVDGVEDVDAIKDVDGVEDVDGVDDADTVEGIGKGGIMVGDGIDLLIVKQELPNKVVEMVAKPSEIMVVITRLVTVSMKKVWIVNSTISIMTIMALTDNRDLRCCGKVDVTSTVIGARINGAGCGFRANEAAGFIGTSKFIGTSNEAGCRIDAGVGDISKRR